MPTAPTNSGISPQVLGLIDKNTELLTRIFKVTKDELLQQFRLYKDQDELYRMLQALTQRGIVITPTTESLIGEFKGNIARAWDYGLTTGNTTPTPMVRVMRDMMTQNVQQYLTRLDTETKTRISNEINRAIEYNRSQPIPNKRIMPKQLAENISRHLDGNIKKAVMISRTETMRASNMASWTQHKEEGYTHFVVDSRPGACKYCHKTFRGRVFRIDETSYIPPIHPHCSCVVRYFTSEERAQESADKIRRNNISNREELEEKGYTFPADGTGPLAPGVKRKSPDDVRY